MLNSITIVTGIYPPDIGGPATFIPVLAKKLSENNIDVEVITLSEQRHHPQDHDLPYRITRIRRSIKKPLRNFLVIQKIIKSAKKSQLIFCNSLACESAIASLLTKKTLIQKIAGDISYEKAVSKGRFFGTLDAFQQTKTNLITKLINGYRNFAIHRSNLIITPSHFLKKIVSQWHYDPNHIKIINNKIVPIKPKNYIKNGKFRIVVIARLTPIKCIDQIIHAIKLSEIDCELIIIGDGPSKVKLITFAKQQAIQAQFLGRLSKEETLVYLSNSDLCILNSLYEGYSHTILEAMYYQSAIIASSVGGNPEIIEDKKNGLLFEQNNPIDLAKKIKLLYHDQPYKNQLLINAKKSAEKFIQIDNMIQKYIEIFDTKI